MRLQLLCAIERAEDGAEHEVREDDRDCLVVSAGRNGILDGDYAAARDPIAAGDDLLEIVFDKSPDRRAPIR